MGFETTGFLLHEVLLLAGIKELSGEMILESGNNIGTMIFHDGKVLQAFSPYSRAIGDLLVEDGIITEAELIRMLQQQMRSHNSPIGSFFLKTGRVSIEIIELMVHQQIRQAVKEFMSWQRLHVSFVEKDIKPFDRINLPVHEFIPGDTVKSAISFFSGAKKVHKNNSVLTHDRI